MDKDFNNRLARAMFKMIVAYHMTKISDPRVIAELTGIRANIVESLYVSLVDEGGRD